MPHMQVTVCFESELYIDVDIDIDIDKEIDEDTTAIYLCMCEMCVSMIRMCSDL